MVEATIDVIDRGTFECDLNFLIEGNTMGTRSEPNPDVEFEANAVYNLVIDHPEATILWDTGIHHEAMDGWWPEDLAEAFPSPDASDHRLDDDLADAGYDIDDVDYVLMSHLHSDHTGGLPFFADRDTPVLVHEEELKWAYYSGKSEAGGAGYLPADFDHDLNWEVVHTQHDERFEDVELVHLPGHTPGLLGVVIDLDDAGTVVFAGDEVYRETNYVDEVPLGAGLLWSKPDWFQSLQLLQRLERERDAQIVYGHDPGQFEEIRDGWP